MNNDMLTGVLLASAVTRRLAALPEGATTSTPSRLEAGMQVAARIVSQAIDGEFVLQIGQQAVKLALPQGNQPGDTVHLMVLAREPRLTFALLRDGTTASASSSTSLSDTGRFIGLLYGKDVRVDPRSLPAARTVVGTIPDTSRDLASALARNLARAVSESGLFYEAHLAEWTRGERTIAQIMREPQASLSPGAEAGSDAASEALQTTAKVADTPVHPDALGMVRAQLDLLEQGAFQWQGEIWPGQQMRWQVGEDPNDRRVALDQPPRRWTTRITLHLPHLGEVSADIALSGKRVEIAITAAERPLVSALEASSAGLATALASAGIDPARIAVSGREAA